MAVIDHVGDPAIDNSRLHRVPPADVREWIEAAGLEVVEESNLMRNNADDHTLSANMGDRDAILRPQHRPLSVCGKKPSHVKIKSMCSKLVIKTLFAAL